MLSAYLVKELAVKELNKDHTDEQSDTSKSNNIFIIYNIVNLALSWFCFEFEMKPRKR